MSGSVNLLTDQRIPGHCLEPGWIVGDPTSLAHDNIIYNQLFSNVHLIRVGIYSCIMGTTLSIIPVYLMPFMCKNQ